MFVACLENSVKSFSRHTVSVTVGILAALPEKYYELASTDVEQVSILGIFLTLYLIVENPIENARIFYNCLILDSLSVYLKIFILVNTIICLLMSKK